MVIRRSMKRTYRRRPRTLRFRKRSTYRRRRFISNANMVIPVKRVWRGTNWSPNTVSTPGFWLFLTSRLADIPNYTEYTALYDMYRIKGLKFTFVPRFSGFDGANTTDTTAPGVTNQGGTLLSWCVDKYSRVSPTGTYTSTTLNDFLQNGNCKTYSGNRQFSIYIRNPAVDTTYAADDGAGMKSSPWLSTTRAGIQHNGLHVFAHDVNMTGTFGNQYDIFVTAYIQFKGMK